MLAVWVLVAFALGRFDVFGRDQGNASEPVATNASIIGGEGGESVAAGGPEVEEVAPEPIISGPYVQATLDDGHFTLDGRVPSAEIATSLLVAAEAAYAPFVSSELAVDDELPEATWLRSGPDVISTLVSLETGTVLLAEGGVSVVGRAPSQELAAQFEQELVTVSGLPVDIDNMEIANLRPPVVTIQADGGQASLTGSVPTEEIRDRLVQSMYAAYGEQNVVAGVAVDPAVFSALWMHSSDSLLSALSAFPDYKIRLEGGSFSGFVGGGAQFEAGSADLNPEQGQVLDFIADVMARDRSLTLLIEGHTDNAGDDQYNLELSQRRAESVKTYLVTGGVAPERLTAEGKGEFYPIAPNDSADGQARNRRVGLTLGAATA